MNPEHHAKRSIEHHSFNDHQSLVSRFENTSLYTSTSQAENALPNYTQQPQQETSVKNATDRTNASVSENSTLYHGLPPQRETSSNFQPSQTITETSQTSTRPYFETSVAPNAGPPDNIKSSLSIQDTPEFEEELELVELLIDQGKHQASLKNYPKSEQLLSKAIKRMNKPEWRGVFSDFLINTYIELWDVNLEMTEYQKAVTAGECAFEFSKTIHKDHSRDDFIDLPLKLAGTYMLNKQLEFAMTLCTQVLRERQKLFGKKSQEYHQALALKIGILQEQGHDEEAFAYYSILPQDIQNTIALRIDTAQDNTIAKSNSLDVEPQMSWSRALTEGNVLEVERHLRAGVDVTMSVEGIHLHTTRMLLPKFRNHPACIALASRQNNICTLLLNHGPISLFNSNDPLQSLAYALLMILAYTYGNSDFDLIKLIWSKTLHTPMKWIILIDVMEIACSAGEIEVVRWCINHAPGLIECKGGIYLCDAVMSGRLLVARLLLENGADKYVNDVFYSLGRPWYEMRDDKDMRQLLMHYGAVVDR